MNRRSEPLDNEERAIADLLARDALPGPSPQLDARILAAARASTSPARATRPRPRWIAGMGIAATLVLAVGIAWRLRPLPERPMPRSVPVAAVGVMEPRADSNASAAGTAVYAPPMQPPPVAKPIPAERESAAATSKRAPSPEPPVVFDEPAPTDSAAPEAFAAPPPPAPPPPPATPAPGHIGAGAPAAKASANTAESARVQEQAATLDKVQVTGSLITGNRMNAADAADAAASGEVLPSRAELDEEPPATADSPRVQDAWLQRIRELVSAGNTDAARGSLAEFRRRYPKYPLPDDLRQLAKP